MRTCRLNPGRHLLLRNSTPMTNLYTAVLERVDVKADRVGDRAGRLKNI